VGRSAWRRLAVWINLEKNAKLEYFIHDQSKKLKMLADFKRWSGLSFRLKVILTFSTITVALVGIMSWISYHFVRNIYIDQLSDQVGTVVKMVGSELDTKYLALLHQNDQTSLANRFYQNILSEQVRTLSVPASFIFDRGHQILVHTDSSGIGISGESRLLLNRAEIQRIVVGESITSLPFEAEDGSWYMWGFYRLSDDYWLGMQESASRLAEVNKFAGMFLLIGLLGIALAILASWLLASTIARPVERLASFSKALGMRNFNTRIPKVAGRELSILAGAMDEMRSDLVRNQLEKEEMLAQIAHEIRNPLGGIELLAGLIKEDLEKKGESSDYINKIEDEIRGLKLLITSYLNYSRPAPAKPEWVDPQEIVREVEEMLKFGLEKKKIELSGNSAPDPVWFDPGHLRQILMNLVGNSVEAVDREGKILVQTSRSDNDFLITVSDNGPGIPAEQQGMVFQPFFTTRDEGTGLGLAICKKLCEQNGASITVENNHSGGCIVTIKKSVHLQ
jgi:signal transduction histidine kinase